MNMMLVSVTERTREIGTRKALGAPNKWIMFQFLSESILISFMGSFVGMIIGVCLSQVAGYYFGRDVPISIWSVVISVSVAVIVGIVSGLMPAIKAMKLDPIDALRFQ
jgi:putative ABC transport system permease protein